jgi:DNA-binding NarL/FixJ family response regulator
MVESKSPGRFETEEVPAPLAGLIEALELLAAQARVYDQVLPRSSAQARLVAAALGELAQRALNEARHLEAALQPTAEPGLSQMPFSPRERQVLALASQGLTNKEIAYRLGISERTVQFHMNSVFNKTGAGSRTEAVTLALKQGWLED